MRPHIFSPYYSYLQCLAEHHVPSINPSLANLKVRKSLSSNKALKKAIFCGTNDITGRPTRRSREVFAGHAQPKPWISSISGGLKVNALPEQNHLFVCSFCFKPFGIDHLLTLPVKELMGHLETLIQPLAEHNTTSRSRPSGSMLMPLYPTAVVRNQRVTAGTPIGNTGSPSKHHYPRG
ncbi:uncharacterized protein EI90DRAFT_3033406 [Cantharellus anzutake]|uniref:uncharacterized protein n=1 Tax=Cantharellus anzutake TaxID=1750568 RepID=UPI001906ECF6|nr:uncharacterized protein EI90DRAFT_3033406 [Cantharellus anzutake]KAF8341298.1 hypothetical protein EI90DRAFT_3033406 [Cantharellus anzutake]